MSDLSQLVPPDQRFDYNYRGTLQTLQPPVGSGTVNEYCAYDVVGTMSTALTVSPEPLIPNHTVWLVGSLPFMAVICS